MNYESLEKGIGVVILGHFNPRQFTKKELLALNVIKQEEDGLARQDAADDVRVVFNVGNLRALCDQYRFQLYTKDIVMSPRLVLFCREVVNTVGAKSIRGLGLNTHLMVSLTNEIDNKAFIRKLMPPAEDWNTLSDGGYVKNIIIKHDGRTISFSPMGDNDNNCYEFNVNKHHSLNKIVDVLSVLDKANEYFSSELKALDFFIHGL